MTHKTFPHSELTGLSINSFLETHAELGHGFSERVYQRALAIVMTANGLNVRMNVPLSVQFRGAIIGAFTADIIVNDTVLVELKALHELDSGSVGQLLNYLKAAGGGVGLLFNFGRHPQFKRLVMGDPENSLPLLSLTAIGDQTGTH